MPVPLQGTYSPAIAKRRRRGREGGCYQPDLGWAQVGVLPFPAADGIAYQDSSGNLVLWGMLNRINGGGYLTPVHFDVNTLAVTTGPNLPGFNNGGWVTAQVGSKLYTMDAGFDQQFYSYDLDARAWTQLANAPRARGNIFAMVAMPNGTIVIIGGVDGNGNGIASIDVYNIAGNSWSTDTATTAGVAITSSAGVLDANGAALVTWAGFASQFTGTWTPGSWSAVDTYIPRKMPVGFSNRTAQCALQLVPTTDGNYILPSNPTNITPLGVIRFPQNLGPAVADLATPFPLVEAVGITRPSDGTSLFWEAYPSSQGGNTSVGFVSYLNGTFGTIINLPEDRHLQIMAGHPTKKRWFSFGGAKDGQTVGTTAIYALDA